MRINYPNTRVTNRQLGELIQLPIYSISPEALRDYEENYFGRRCQGSRTLIEQAKEHIPEGVQHSLAFNRPFPLVITKAAGHKLTDIDGNVYFDFLRASGPTTLGSNPPGVREEVIRLLQGCGPPTGLFHGYEYKLANLIASRIPTVNQLRMLGSGTEACMATVRVARLVTRKKHILEVGGAYHGWSGQLTYGIRAPGLKFTQAHGVPWTMFHYIGEFRPDDLADLECKLRPKKLHDSTAAVTIEPIGPESDTWPIDQVSLKGVRKLCRRYGALLIFDEVVTAFRINDRGASGLFGIGTDLTVLGEVTTRGYPGAGGLGSEKEYLKYLAAGIQNGGKVHKVLIGGAIATAPISCVAGCHTVKHIIETGAYEYTGKMGDRLTDGLKALAQKYDLPFVTWNEGSVYHLETVGTMHSSINWSRPWTISGTFKETSICEKGMEYMGATYTAEGLITLAGSRLYASAAYVLELIDETLTRFERVLQKVIKEWLKRKPTR